MSRQTHFVPTEHEKRFPHPKGNHQNEPNPNSQKFITHNGHQVSPAFNTVPTHPQVYTTIEEPDSGIPITEIHVQQTPATIPTTTTNDETSFRSNVSQFQLEYGLPPIDARSTYSAPIDRSSPLSFQQPFVHPIRRYPNFNPDSQEKIAMASQITNMKGTINTLTTKLSQQEHQMAALRNELSASTNALHQQITAANHQLSDFLHNDLKNLIIQNSNGHVPTTEAAKTTTQSTIHTVMNNPSGQDNNSIGNESANTNDDTTIHSDPRYFSGNNSGNNGGDDDGNDPSSSSSASSASTPSSLSSNNEATATLMKLFKKMSESNSNEEKLKLPQLQKPTKQQYLAWKMETFKLLHTNSKFKKYTVLQHITRGPHIMSRLPGPKRDVLYNALSKALSKEIKNEIGMTSSNDTDPLAVLKALDREYGLQEKVGLSKLNLANQLNGCRKDPNETIHTFHQRFKHLVEACQVNQVMPYTTQHQLTLLYLRALKEPAFYPVLLNIETKNPAAKEWLTPRTLDELRNKVIPFLEAYRAINGSTPAKESKNKEKTNKTKKDKDNKKEYQSSTNDEYKKKSSKLRAIFQNNSSLEISKQLDNLQRTCKGCCWLHQKDSHDLFTCKKVKALADEYDKDIKKPTVVDGEIKAKRLTKKNKALKKERQALINEKREMKKLIKALQTTVTNQSNTHSSHMEDSNPFAQLMLSDSEESSNDSEIEQDSDDDDSTINIVPTQNNADVNHYSQESNSEQSTSQTEISVPTLTARRASQHTNNYMVVDSGATTHMDNDKEIFEYLTPITDDDGNPITVVQGDGTSLEVPAMGPVKKKIGNMTIRYLSYYVPDLEVPLFAVKQHIKYQGCYFHAENNRAILVFPSTILKLKCEPEICFKYTHTNAQDVPTFDYETAKLSQTTSVKIRAVQQRYVNPDFSTKQQDTLAETITFNKIHPQAVLPSRATEGSIGHDLTTTTAVRLTKGQTHVLPTGLAMAIPTGMYGRIAERSSMAIKGISVGGGVIDSDYRGEIKVILTNNSNEDVYIKAGQRIAQIIFEYASIPFIHTSTILPTTQRGSKGFGSTNPKPPRHRLFRIQGGCILQYITKKGRRRAKRVHQQIQQGLHVPSPVTHYDQDKYWTAHSLHNDENREEDDILLQTNPQQKPKDSYVPSTTPTADPTAKVNASEPKIKTLNTHQIRQSVGFLQHKDLITNLAAIGQPNVKFKDISPTIDIDPGLVASIPSAKRNTTKRPSKSKYGELWHMDIGYGPCSSIGGIKYTLLLVDSATRYKYVYPLKNLTTSLLRAIKRFFKDCQCKPGTIRTDFDAKLLQGKVAEHIEEVEKVKLEAAPPYRQHQNGLVERAWQSIVTMTRNWLTSSLLPSKYWWFGVKRAVEVLNMMPVKRNGTVTTPHELVYKNKPDYRTLFPLFSIAYIKQNRETGGQHKNKWKTKTLKCILVGTDNKSDGLLFYHPPSKQLLTGNNGYRLDTYLPSGPQFNETFDGSFQFNTKGDMDAIHRPMAFEEGNNVYLKQEDKYVQAKIVAAPLDDENDTYTIQETLTGNLRELNAEDISDHDPTAVPEDPSPTTLSHPFPLLPWIKPDAKATLYLPKVMKSPKQGFLQYDDITETWSFIPGRNKSKPPITLPNFKTLAQSLVTNKKLFQGWKTNHKVLTARILRGASNLVASNWRLIARHISAKSLDILEAPTLLRHKKLTKNDRSLWDAAYDEEYDGLIDLPAWEIISEQEYQRLKPIVGHALPTMAISTIKKDELGNPKRCKYRIVALGNLDPNHWNKTDCFAPVLSQPDLRLLCAIAAKRKCIPKVGDVSQAFVQSTLPPDEPYVLRPPPGCPRTPQGTYWKLKRTLYGLKRSPRHWYEKAKTTLQQIGLKPVQNSSCIFHGTPIKGHPPIYVGIYVDDFIYFSESRKVEEHFEAQFEKHFKVTWEGDASHFLGIHFQTHRYENGDVWIHLSQEAFIDTLVQKVGLDGPISATTPTPYRAGYPVDKIPQATYTTTQQNKITHRMQQLTGCLQWLSTSTRPDISTITNMLSKYNHKATKGHLDAAKTVIRYLKGTRELGISFKTNNADKVTSFVKFPIPSNTITPFCDANWGPQDQSKPKGNDPAVDLFKSRSISGYLLWLNGPLHWQSKRQTITARSTAEAEIYATDECTKSLIHLYNILHELHLANEFMPRPTSIYNDNAACVQWSHSLTTKGLRHVQIRENAVRESVQRGDIIVEHIKGELNMSDLFTKEDKDASHFIKIRDTILDKFAVPHQRKRQFNK